MLPSRRSITNRRFIGMLVCFEMKKCLLFFLLIVVESVALNTLAKDFGLGRHHHFHHHLLHHLPHLPLTLITLLSLIDGFSLFDFGWYDEIISKFPWILFVIYL